MCACTVVRIPGRRGRYTRAATSDEIDIDEEQDEDEDD